MHQLRVAIVGGSIAGCTIGVLLRQLGHEVKIFERTPISLEQRGAGIGIPPALIDACIQHDLFDKNVVYYPIKSRSFYRKGGSSLFWQQPLNTTGFNWGILFQQLRKRFPNTHYHTGFAVKRFEKNENKTITLYFENNSFETFDLVIFSDGYRSIGRQQLYPDIKAHYSGYVAWRGILSFKEQFPAFLNEVAYFCFPQGHALFYYVPQIESKELTLNWLLYQKQEQAFVDRYNGTLAPGAVPQIINHELWQFARENLPQGMAQLIQNTTAPFLQGIYDMLAPAGLNGNVLLVGDANTVVRPHIGSGATKALQEALLLYTVLQNYHDIDEALQQWECSRQAENKRLFNLGQTVGDAMVLHTPDWQCMNQLATETWWSNLMSGQHWYATDDLSS